MAKIFILGGYGLTGRSLARHLLERSNTEIILAGRNLDKASSYADQLNTEFAGQRVSAALVDAADQQSLQLALHKVDLLLVAAPTAQYANTVIHAALESGTDYLDVQLDSQKLTVLSSHAPEFERTGRCFITEAGFHPGMPAAMIRYAAAQMDQLETACTAGYLNMGPDMPYSEAFDELMRVFLNYQAQVFMNGQWTKTGVQGFVARKVDFGGKIGVRKCYSMFLEELRALPEMYPTLKDVGFFMSESHWFLDGVIFPIVYMGLKMGRGKWLHPLGKLLWWGMKTLPKPPYDVLLYVEATGEKNGSPVIVKASISHPDGYELTAIPVVACILQYLDGSARRPGLWMMGHLVEPKRLFSDMEKMGVKVTNVPGSIG